MLRHMRIWIVFLMLFAGCTRKPPPAAHNDPAESTPAQSVGIDESAIDMYSTPCDDFYQYACGNRLKGIELPADVDAVDEFSAIADRDLARERELLATIGQSGNMTAASAKLAAFWTACMDEPTIERTAPVLIKERLTRIGHLKSMQQLAVEIAREHRDGVDSLFTLRLQPKSADAAAPVVVIFDQGGLTLPTADEYLREEPKYAALRNDYRVHIERMLALAGASAAQARQDSGTIVQLETALAALWMTGAEDDDDANPYDDITKLDRSKSHFKFKPYLHYLGIDDKSTNVAAPLYFGRLDAELARHSLSDWKAYLRWHLLHSLAPLANRAMVDEDFAFFGSTLHGVEAADTRSTQCVKSADRYLGSALGDIFGQKTLGAAGKDAAMAMARDIQNALKADLTKVAWLDETTRNKASIKLDRIIEHIGYPDQVDDYATLVFAGDSYLQEVEHIRNYEFDRALRQLGKPRDRQQWTATPASVVGRYDSATNSVTFSAGLLQPPLFDVKAAPAVQFGALGALIGHELTHALDPIEESVDADGQAQYWWTAAIDPQHKARAKCFVDQYNDYSLSGGGHIDGFATLGENIADAGGLALAHAAYVATRNGAAPAKLGRWTDEQLFFVAAAQARCVKERPRKVAGGHSMQYYRVNGTVANSPDFAGAFACKAGDKMVRANICQLW